MPNNKYYIENKDALILKMREYGIKNKEKIRERKRLNYLKNKEEICLKSKEYRKTHKEHYRKYFKERSRRKRKDDLGFKLIGNLRSRIWIAVKRQTKGSGTREILGCSIEFLRKHLESQFKEEMSWDNYGRGGRKWQIDHIKPCASFDLTKPEDQRKCFHYSNLQPLWQKDNLEKRSSDSLLLK